MQQKLRKNAEEQLEKTSLFASEGNAEAIIKLNLHIRLLGAILSQHSMFFVPFLSVSAIKINQ